MQMVKFSGTRRLVCHSCILRNRFLLCVNNPESHLGVLSKGPKSLTGTVVQRQAAVRLQPVL